ncbi:Hypothetical predicted protein [Paramuricea clavata]|uniref:Uncharacterized protein n=1 Tax=Paramuricea clavata TaxID=317549 RepID=A0A7D9L0D7_PARCT|nr:Hypothetical predicted protein [Paramuricea clavata]
MLTTIDELDEFKKKLQKGQIQRDTFKPARNKVVRLVEKAKKDNIVNEIENNKFDSKVLWKTLKKIFPTKATKSGKVKTFEKDGTMYTTPEEISNLFNEHFVAVANNIIESNNSTYPEFTKLENFVRLQKGINSYNLSIPTVTESEVLELVRSLPSHVATGLDGLSSHLLKIIASAIAPSLTKIFNCSLINGTVPSAN